jgi:hypothetical protein
MKSNIIINWICSIYLAIVAVAIITALLLTTHRRTTEPGVTPLPPAFQNGKSSFSDPGTQFRDIEKKQHNTVFNLSRSPQTNSIMNIMLSVHLWTVNPFLFAQFGKVCMGARMAEHHPARWGKRHEGMKQSGAGLISFGA